MVHLVITGRADAPGNGETEVNLTDIIADAAYYVSRDCELSFDAACDACREAAADALADGIAFDAPMLADVVSDRLFTA